MPTNNTDIETTQGKRRCFLAYHVKESMTFWVNKYVGIGAFPGCFLLRFQTIRKLILNCACSYVFFIRNAMFTVKFPAHDTPGNFTFIAVC